MNFHLSNPFARPPDLLLSEHELMQFLMMQGFFQVEVNLPPAKSKEMHRLRRMAKEYVELVKHRPEQVNELTTFLERIAHSILKRQSLTLQEPERKALERFAYVLASGRL